MSSLKEIKGRIVSVQTTQKTTSAMRMVASAKLHRTQTLTQTFLEYVTEMQKIVDCLQPVGLDAAAGEASATDAAMTSATAVPASSAVADLDAAGHSVALVAVSSSSGLCGAFNSNISKATFAKIKEYEAHGVKVTVIPVGKKIAHEFQKADIDFCHDYIQLAEGVGNPKVDAFSQSSELVSHLCQLKAEGQVDSVEFVYHHFKNMGSQVITSEFLDITGSPVEGETCDSQENKLVQDEYITEPTPAELLADLHPKMLNSKVYGILLDSVTSEHAARMMAMQTADDNAKELMQELTLLYNKSRQQAITNELIDIMGGKVAQ